MSKLVKKIKTDVEKIESDIKEDITELSPVVKKFAKVMEKETGKALVLVGSVKLDTLKETALSSAIMSIAGEKITTAEAQAISKIAIDNFDKITTAAGEKLEAINQ